MKQKRIPKWLLDLPAGKYSLTELSAYANKSKNSVCRTLKTIGLDKEYIFHYVRQNFAEAFYTWDGGEIHVFRVLR